MIVAALVLAAGSSQRLGQPKQLLPFRDATLLDATIETVTGFGFAQTIVTLGGAAPEVRETVDLSGVDVVDSVHHTNGCSSSIVSALDAINPEAAGFMLFLGDQPGVPSAAVDSLLVQQQRAPSSQLSSTTTAPVIRSGSLAACSVRSLTCTATRRCGSFSSPVNTRRPACKSMLDIPLDVDTWEDYQQLLAND